MHGKIASLLKVVGKLPGITQRTAKKIGFTLLQNESLRAELKQVLEDADMIQRCQKCNMYTESKEIECAICMNPARDKQYICVVADMLNLIAIEKTKAFNGLYHVLHGLISHLDHVGPDELPLQSLLERIKADTVTELLIGLSPTTEGQATAYYIKSLLSDLPVNVKMLGVGVSIGSDLEYLDSNTIAVSIKNKM